MKKPQIIILVIILALLGFIIYPWVILPIKTSSTVVTSPISSQFINFSDSTKSFFNKLISINRLDKENNDLKQENSELKARLAKFDETKRENEILKKELQFVDSNQSQNYLPALVIAYSPNAYTKSIKINRGTKDGIKNNQPVISDGFLVGVVSNTYENSADVVFISDNNSLIPFVLEKSRATGLLRGGLKGLVAEEIPLDTKIEEGETILTSGLGGDLPAAIPIGKIKKVISAESEIFQKATVESPLNFSHLETVFVIKQ